MKSGSDGFFSRPYVRGRAMFVTKQAKILNVLKIAVVMSLAIIGLVIFIFPYFWVVATSLKPTLAEALKVPPTFIPSSPTLKYYKDLFEKLNFLLYTRNTLIFACTVTACQIFFNSLGGYAFAKYKFPGREFLFVVVLATMMIPNFLLLIPRYLIVQHLKMLDSFQGLIVPNMVGAAAIFLMRQFMGTIPDELLESGRVDGCSEFGIFWKIMLPQCKPIVFVTAIFGFTGAWNDLFWPLIIANSEKMYTIVLGLALLQGEHGMEWNLMMAGSVVVSLPLIILFLIFQKKLIKGVVLTGLKG